MAENRAPMRADARRNRVRLVEAAKHVFAAGGDTGPEAVARKAGVGVGTLYRHFPTRAALAEAVYEDELQLVAASAAGLLAKLPPPQALRAWMDRFAKRMENKRAMADVMRALIATGAVTSAGTRARLAEAVQNILDAGAATGALRRGVRGDDLVATLVGIVLVCPGAEQREQAGRLMDLLAAGVAAGRSETMGA